VCGLNRNGFQGYWGGDYVTGNVPLWSPSFNLRMGWYEWNNPSSSMRRALSPAMKALVSKELLTFLSMDVKLFVVVCLIEIFRINALDAPYCDDQTRDIFQLIVAVLEDTFDTLFWLVYKHTWIFEIISQVKLYLLMLDLKCDSLVEDNAKMFLQSYTNYFSKDMFLNMDYMMIEILKEIYEIPLELVFLLLDNERLDNQAVSFSTLKLVDSVPINCILELPPSLHV
jgi:hypothetical protein